MQKNYLLSSLCVLSALATTPLFADETAEQNNKEIPTKTIVQEEPSELILTEDEQRSVSALDKKQEEQDRDLEAALEY